MMNITPGDRQVPKTTPADEIVKWVILIAVLLAFVVPLTVGIGRWMWDWALENEHVQVDERDGDG